MTLARRVVFVATGVVLTLISCSGGDSSDDSEVLPDVELVGLKETAVNTSSWVGEPLVINFWFSTCIPCATELIDFAEVDAARGDQVRFVGVNPIDTPEAMVAFAGERGVTYDLFRDELAKFQEELRVAQFPATYFVASDGTIVDSAGVLNADELNQQIDKLLTADGTAQEATT